MNSIFDGMKLDALRDLGVFEDDLMEKIKKVKDIGENDSVRDTKLPVPFMPDMGMDEEMDKRMKERMNGRTNGRTDGRTNERTDGRTNERTDGRTNERTDGRTNERTDGRTNERTDGRRHISANKQFSQKFNELFDESQMNVNFGNYTQRSKRPAFIDPKYFTAHDRLKQKQYEEMRQKEWEMKQNERLGRYNYDNDMRGMNKGMDTDLRSKDIDSRLKDTDQRIQMNQDYRSVSDNKRKLAFVNQIESKRSNIFESSKKREQKKDTIVDIDAFIAQCNDKSKSNKNSNDSMDDIDEFIKNCKMQLEKHTDKRDDFSSRNVTQNRSFRQPNSTHTFGSSPAANTERFPNSFGQRPSQTSPQFSRDNRDNSRFNSRDEGFNRVNTSNPLLNKYPSRHDSSRHDSSRHDLSHRDPPRHDSSHRDPPRHDPSHRDLPRHDPRQDRLVNTNDSNDTNPLFPSNIERVLKDTVKELSNSSLFCDFCNCNFNALEVNNHIESQTHRDNKERKERENAAATQMLEADRVGGTINNILNAITNKPQVNHRPYGMAYIMSLISNKKEISLKTLTDMTNYEIASIEEAETAKHLAHLLAKELLDYKMRMMPANVKEALHKQGIGLIGNGI